MAAFDTEQVLSVHHWNDTLFSFTTTRGTSLRFESGHFVMIGLEVDGRPLARAYSVASAAYEEHLEFLSIKVPAGPLTSRLQHLKVGDPVLIGKKPTGTLVVSDLRPGRTVYMFATGTGLAPFMSLIRDPQTYARFERVVLVHGVRYVSELAYATYIQHELQHHALVGEDAKCKLLYYPTVTREPFRNQGRITGLIETGALAKALGLPALDAQHDRAMICGGPDMLRDTRAALDKLGFHVSPGIGEAGDYVIERAFAEK
jgi:ferredoxin/flavodoxin---NADP+ reductase